MGSMSTLAASWSSDFTSNSSREPPQKPNVADVYFSKQPRVIVLYIQVIIGTIGAFLVFSWLWYNRRRKSRVNALILHVAMSDFFVIVGACLTQLIWELHNRNWTLGDVLCKLLKFVQTFSMTSSNYMVVVLSIDRHQAIRSPLREPFAVSTCSFTYNIKGYYLLGSHYFVNNNIFIHTFKNT